MVNLSKATYPEKQNNRVALKEREGGERKGKRERGGMRIIKYAICISRRAVSIWGERPQLEQ